MKHQSTRKLRWLLPVALLAIMASSGLWYWQAPDSEPRPDPAKTFASAPAVTPPAVTQASAPVPSNKEPPHQTPTNLPDHNFARSLTGTDIDGALKAELTQLLGGDVARELVSARVSIGFLALQRL